MNNMFVDIEKFEQEKALYDQQLKELDNMEMPDTARETKKEELTNTFRSNLRKYLTLALGIINDILGIKYSLYHQGKDFDSNFKQMDTTVAKTIDEINNELDNFKIIGENKNIGVSEQHKLDLAIKIIATYALDRELQNKVPVKKTNITKDNLEDNGATNSLEENNIKIASETDHSKPIALIVVTIIALAIAILFILKII